MQKEENDNDKGKWQMAFWILVFFAGTVSLLLLGGLYNETNARVLSDQKICEEIVNETQKIKDGHANFVLSIKDELGDIKANIAVNVAFLKDLKRKIK